MSVYQNVILFLAVKKMQIVEISLFQLSITKSQLTSHAVLEHGV